MNRINGLILTTVLALAMCSIAASFFTASLAQPGQQDPSGLRKPACGCFICGDLAREASRRGINLPFNTVDFEDKKDCAGILAEDACPAELAKIPKEKRESFCQKIKSGFKFTSFKDSCPVFAPICEPEEPTEEKQPPDTKCDPPSPRQNDPPWFNENAACQNRQQGTYSWGQNRRNPRDVSYTISMCGQVIRFVQPGMGMGVDTRLPPGVKSFDVCCDSWQNAVSTSSPCDAQRDIDCDGILNESDFRPVDARPKRGRSDDFVSNSPLSDLPFWKELYEGMPSQSDCKDCKWEVIGVQYTCENRVYRTGRRSERIDAEYEYKATWKCPANGQTQVTDDSATMEGLRCPTPPNQSWP